MQFLISFPITLHTGKETRNSKWTWVISWIIKGVCSVTAIITMMSRESYGVSFNTLRPRQNGRHFADDVFICIFLNENVWILLKISLKFVPKGSINNIPSLVQVMPRRRPGDKPLSEPMMVILLTHIRVARPQWVNRPIESSVQKFIRTRVEEISKAQHCWKQQCSKYWHAMTSSRNIRYY